MSQDSPDGQGCHVHSQWSWDALRGDMRATCARAVQIGLRSLAFTEHADFTPWQLHDAEVPRGVRGRVSPGGTFLGEPLDVEGYLECVEDCRRRFPELRILGRFRVGRAASPTVGGHLGRATARPRQAAVGRCCLTRPSALPC